MFIAKWRSGRPRTHIAEKDFVLERILNSPYVISTLPFIWLPLQPDMGPPRTVLRPRMGHKLN